MARTTLKETLAIPKGVTVTLNADQMHVKGHKGEITKAMPLPVGMIRVEAHDIVFEVPESTQRQKNLLFTCKAHANNMMKGVSEGYLYKLKICSGHFPMSVTMKGDQFEIKNFIGEKVPRHLKLKKGADVKIAGDIIEVTSHDKELAGQVAADIEQLARRPGFDKRIFQDGIYITEKAGKHM